MIHTERITSAQHPLLDEWWQLYEAAFPVTERRSAYQHAAALENPAFHCLHLSDSTGFVGIMAYWMWQDTIYLEHLAITPERRGQGLGHHVLASLEGTVVVEIEPATDSVSVRRLAFYESCGFYCLSYPHVQLAYQDGQPDIALWLLSRPQLDEPAIQAFETLYHMGPMQYRDAVAMGADSEG